MGLMQLRVISPKGGSAGVLEVDSTASGQELKAKLEEFLDIPAETQSVFFQNGTRNAAKIALDDQQALNAQGIENQAAITVRVNEKQVSAEESKLRQSIVKNGGSSYYYAHANEKELPLQLRYVYGGAPEKIAEADVPIEDLTQEVPTQVISKYSWANEGDFVCIYVSAEGELDAIQAAKDGKHDEVKVEFDSRCVELRILGNSKIYALVLRGLESEIVPEESRFRVSPAKRITLKLKKRRPENWMRLVRPK